jgi:uncharacterized protein YdeI (YjbR/CyaY-like superfamily)
MKTIYFETIDDWRAWLEENHQIESEVWLIFNKKETGLPSIPYGEAVEQALCFGWVDSLIKKLDETQYVRKFTPRKLDSKWSALNVKRVERMIEAGWMTPHGLRLVEAAKKSGKWDKPEQKPKLDFPIQPEFRDALIENPKAKKTFDSLAPTYQKQYLTWIGIAKRPATRSKRIIESIKLLSKGEKLGLK